MTHGSSVEGETEILLGRSPSSNESSVQLQDGIIHAEDRYCCGKLKRSFHLCSIVTSVTVWIIVIATITMLIIDPTSVGAIVCYCIIPFVLFMYVLETLASGTLRYLIRFKTLENVLQYIQRLKGYAPEIGFRCEVRRCELECHGYTEIFCIIF